MWLRSSYRVAYDPGLQTAILRTFVRTLEGWQCRRARQAGLVEPQWGAVTLLQRFGSALQLIPHQHTLGTDGVFTVDRRRERARFHALEPPTREEVAGLVQRVATRVISRLVRRGLLSVEDEAWAEPDRLVQEEPAVAACHAAAVQGRLAFGEGAGQRLARLGQFPVAPRSSLMALAVEQEYELDPRRRVSRHKTPTREKSRLTTQWVGTHSSCADGMSG